MLSALPGPDGRPRCEWCLSADDYIAYHDDEWGFPVSDDRRLFEKLSLEGFQSGLSWLTILRKRDAFREAFHRFDHVKVAAMGPRDVERLLDNPAIVRHRGKIEAVINNAALIGDLIDSHGSLASFVWSFEPSSPELLASTSPESTSMAKDLKKRGFRFVGPTTAHAFMQSMGLLNDHLPTCVTHSEVERARRDFRRP